MNETTSHPAPVAAVTTADTSSSIDRTLERRAALRSRHSAGLTRLLDQRAELRGVNALADLVDDAVRWTA